MTAKQETIAAVIAREVFTDPARGIWGVRQSKEMFIWLKTREEAIYCLGGFRGRADAAQGVIYFLEDAKKAGTPDCDVVSTLRRTLGLDS